MQSHLSKIGALIPVDRNVYSIRVSSEGVPWLQNKWQILEDLQVQPPVPRPQFSQNDKIASLQTECITILWL